jgi:Kelch motif
MDRVERYNVKKDEWELLPNMKHRRSTGMGFSYAD